MGLAYVFSQAAYVLYHFRATDYGAIEGRAQTALGIPLILLFFLIVGLRVSFSIPMEVRANWLFRLTDPFSRRRLPERRAQDTAAVGAGAGGGDRGAGIHGRVAAGSEPWATLRFWRLSVC